MSTFVPPMTDGETVDVGPDLSLVGTRVGASATDAPTGPQPVLHLVDGRLQVENRRDVTVIALDGGLDSDFADDLAPAVASAVRNAPAVVIDLDQVTLLDGEGLQRICETVDGASQGEQCLVASRLSGRLVLERWGVADRYPVFTSVADALQARAFEASGYGDGWTLTD